jgi:hypothetical protein
MERVYAVKGWNEAVGRVMQAAVIAQTREAARREAESQGLRHVIVVLCADQPPIPGRDLIAGRPGRDDERPRTWSV